MTKIEDIRKVVKNRISQIKRKTHFINVPTDAMMMNNEVIENFNFELEKVKLKKPEEIILEKTEKEDSQFRRKKLKLPSVLSQS